MKKTLIQVLLLMVLFLLALMACAPAPTATESIPYPTRTMTTVRTVAVAYAVTNRTDSGCTVELLEYGDRFNLDQDWHYKPKQLKDGNDSQFCTSLVEGFAVEVIVTRALPNEVGTLGDIVGLADTIPTESIAGYVPPTIKK